MTTLIETPIPVLLIGAIAVAILAIVFFNTGRAKFLLAIGVVVAITLLGLGVEYFIVTEREAVETALFGLADAMEANDKNAAVAYLSPSAAETRRQAEWAFTRFEVVHANVSDLEIEVNNLTSPPSAQARFQGFIQVKDRKGELPYGSQLFDFVLDYRKENGRWLLTKHTYQFGKLGGRAKKGN